MPYDDDWFDIKLSQYVMTFTPGIRKLGLTAHISFSVGWFGAVVGFLILAISGLISQRPQMVTANYLTMELIGWFVIVPFCLGALLTGILQSLGTDWGLLKHYWIVVKLILTLVATFVLFLHMQPISYLADIASKKELSYLEFRSVRIQLIADACAALFVLLVATTISVYKPWGKIAYGSNNGNTLKIMKSRTPWGFFVLLAIIGLMILVAILHLFGISLGHH